MAGQLKEKEQQLAGLAATLTPRPDWPKQRLEGAEGGPRPSSRQLVEVLLREHRALQVLEHREKRNKWAIGTGS